MCDKGHKNAINACVEPAILRLECKVGEPVSIARYRDSCGHRGTAVQACEEGFTRGSKVQSVQ